MAKVLVGIHDLGERFHPDPERSYNLPAPCYYDPDVYEEEKDKIFYRAWNFVCHGEQVRDIGAFTTTMVADQNVFVIRGRDGALRGFYNVCQHRGHELLKGSGKRKVIACPYHGWTYATDGRLKEARNSQDLPDFDPEEFGLRPVQVEEFCTFLFVNLDPEAPPLHIQSHDLAQEIRGYAPDLDGLTHAHRLTYDIQANWKTVVDNFLECYHCAVAHPAFVELIDMATYRIVTHEFYSSHHARASGSDNAAYDVSSADVVDHAVWWLWPNTCLLRFPGSGNMMVLHIVPAGPERTLVTWDFHFLDKTPDRQQLEAIDYIDSVLQPEDRALVESVQRGLHSHGYQQSRYIIDRERTELSEHGVHHFHSLVLDALKGRAPARERE